MIDALRDDWRARYLAQLTTQRQLSPHSVAAYGRDLAELGALLGHADWPAVSHAVARLVVAPVLMLAIWRTVFAPHEEPGQPEMARFVAPGAPRSVAAGLRYRF